MKRWIALSMLLAACTEPASKPTPSRSSLGQRLASEAASRPERAVRPAQLLEALSGRGVAIARTRQVLASPLDASYCELALTDAGLAVSLCEFVDDDAAVRGLARSRAAFDVLIPGRSLDTRFNALLTIGQPAGPKAQRQRELARAVFASLSPSAR